ncbi:MFS transporter [Ilumatobacter sp.]|uniref:MFS transporter n=1 Tax=Ilumatobacter sp. TaxID=1967498 RepID=UPI003C496D2C
MTLPASIDTHDRSPSPRAILWAVGFSVFVAADDLTVVSTMLRPIIGDLGLVLPDGLDDAAWIVNAYLIAFIAVMPIAGRVSDVIGRRRTFMLAYGIFLVGTIWIPLADSLGPLLVGRVLTAIGGGAMVPIALAVVGDVYPVERRARALGTLGAIETLGWVWGPLYGAMLVRFLTWRWQFWLNVPLAIVGAAAVWWALAEHDRPARDVRVDWIGAGLLTTALVSLNLALLGSAEVQSVQGLDELTGNGGTDLRWLYPLAFVAAALFVFHERRLRRRGRTPLIDAALFRGRNVRVALIVNFVVGAALVIAMVDVPLFVNAVEVDLERSAVIAGWILSAMTAAMALLSYVGGRVTERTWYGPPIVLGLVAATLAYTLMGLTWGGDTPYPVLALQLALLGGGIGLTVAPTTSAVVDHAEPDSRGAAAAVVMVVRMIGLSVGLSALTAWGLARFNALRSEIELPPITDPDFQSALTVATERLTAQSIADTFIASAAALGVGLALCLFLLRRTTTPADPTATEAADLVNSSRTERGTSSRDAPLPVHRSTETEPPPETPMTDDTTPTDDTSTADVQPDEHPDEDTNEHETFVVSRGLIDTDEMPVIADGADPALDPEAAPPVDERSPSWVHRHLTLVLAGVVILLVGSLLATVWMFTRVQAAEDDLATTRADLERVESGAALYASQVNGFVETVNDLGPSIDEGLDQAIAGLEEFGATKIEFQVPIDTSIPIDEEVDTTITIDGPFGIDIPLDITVPVNVDVPINLDVPIALDVAGTELEGLTTSLIDGLRAFQDGLGGLTGN